LLVLCMFNGCNKRDLIVQWLVENYETAEGVSLPRSTLYFHYLQHCNENKLEPMNPASFGKLIRSVFFGLRTRRLGTRGNSKYHYYGIRIKPNSPLNHFVEDAGFSLRHYPNYHRQTMEAAAEWKCFDSRLKQSLSQERLHILVSDSAVLQFVRLYDHTFYQSLAEVLIPNVLRPIPPTLTQAIRNFAKSLEVSHVILATQGLEPTLVSLKLSAVSALAQTLRRYTSLNHLAQAARAVLKNSNQINQMLADLNRVDFNNVQEQASWVCQCSDATVGQLEQDFKRILHKHASLEEWAQWLDNVVSTILQPLEGNSLAYTRAAHQLILKWSFYSSMVIRDLTLRSAASFGSFHLIRLLYDEYIFYLVEHKVAAHLGMTPVAVMDVGLKV
uniref:RFX-type winged-helix domain-containing protein n=1 Tax=Echinostoma caproni TaxID=27848 RepID=A0A183AIV5_9TREM